MSIRSRRRTRAPACARLLLTLAALVAACRGDAPTSDAGRGAPVTVRAALAGTDVRVLAIVVTGPGIAVPIVANVDATADVPSVSVTLDVPVGGQRTFTARGYDGSGVLTHEGIATVVVRPAVNPPVAIRIHPRTGDVPIAIGVGSYRITVSPGVLAGTTVGETRQLTATVSDGSGVAVPGAVVRWGSLDPTVATIDATGLVTSRASGTTTLHASHPGATSVAIDLTVGLPPVRFREVAAGWWSTCALDDAGAAWCWGYGDEGALGDGTSTTRSRPVRVAGGHQFTTIVAGGAHFCALTAAQEMWCWGRNAEQQLGLGPSPGPTNVPQRPIASLPWTAVAATLDRTCGISGGRAYCWSRGVFTPLPNTTSAWSSLALGRNGECLLAADGGAECNLPSGSGIPLSSMSGVAWRTLQVGDWRPEFVNVGLGLPWASTGGFACGLTTSGDARCWGSAEFGELGRGAGQGAGYDQQPSPANVSGPQGYTGLSVGSRFTCGVRAGEARCWGLNDHGQLGDGTQANRFVPTPVTGGWRFTRIAAGLSHACGLTADGAAFCWGENRLGELGDGTTTRRTAPVVVRPTTTP